MGKEGKYDLKLAETPQLSDSDTESECEPGEEEIVESVCQQTGVCHPAKLIKVASYQLMRSLTLGCALHADNMQVSAVNKVTSILRQVVQLGCQSINISAPEHLLLAKDQHKGWATLGLIRAACRESSLCRSMCSQAWISLLFNIVEDTDSGLDCSLPNQVMALRLMTSILPRCPESVLSRCGLMDRLFSLLGHTALMCRTDGSHYGDQVSSPITIVASIKSPHQHFRVCCRK